MKKYNEMTTTKMVLVKKTCNHCGRDLLNNLSEAQECITIDKQCGYGSTFGDGSIIHFDLCQHCIKELLGDELEIDPNKGFDND